MPSTLRTPGAVPLPVVAVVVAIGLVALPQVLLGTYELLVALAMDLGAGVVVLGLIDVALAVTAGAIARALILGRPQARNLLLAAAAASVAQDVLSADLAGDLVTTRIAAHVVGALVLTALLRGPSSSRRHFTDLAAGS